MPELVIDRLEAVEIDQQQGDRFPRRPQLLEAVLQPRQQAARFAIEVSGSVPASSVRDETAAIARLGRHHRQRQQRQQGRLVTREDRGYRGRQGQCSDRELAAPVRQVLAPGGRAGQHLRGHHQAPRSGTR